MSDSRPPEHPQGGGWDRGDSDDRAENPDPGGARPAWHSFGVPHGGAPEPAPYTPAFRERPRPESTPPAEPAAPTEPAAPAAPSAPASSEWDDRSSLTQPIDTSATQEVPPAGPAASAPTSRGWWSTPGSATHPTPEATAGPHTPTVAPVPVPSGTGGYPPPSGQPYASPWAPSGSGPHGSWPPPPPSESTPTQSGAPGPDAAPRRTRPWLPLAVVALVAALVGGGVALLGQQLLSRGTSLGSAVPAPGPGSTARPDGSIAKIAADALPSVVTIRIKTSQGSGTGSGFVIDQQGHILTNNHVVAAAAGSGQMTVELNNGKTLPAKVVGADASYDLAVIKIDATDIPPLQFGASKDVVVGDGVIAVGAPLGLDATVTSGIVSALNRPVSAGDGSDQSFINAIQTDAAINPGNSGGPLLDMNGKVIGVNSAIARIPGSTSDSGGNIGVGFAIPSDQAAKTAQQLITTGKADHPALGVRVDRSYTGDGAKIASGGVQAGSAADKAGLKDGDVITEIDGKKVTDADTLIVTIRSHSVGDSVTLTVVRGGQTSSVTMSLQSATS